VYQILEREIEYRLGTPPPENKGMVVHGDVRQAGDFFSAYEDAVSLVITSPPYLDTTNFIEDQWLRVWFLGGEPRPVADQGRDDRYSVAAEYWKFLQEAWAGLASLLRENARLIIRMGGSKLSFEETSAGLKRSLYAGLGRSVELIEEKRSAISGGQLRSFRPNAAGTKEEFDFHFLVA